MGSDRFESIPIASGSDFVGRSSFFTPVWSGFGQVWSGRHEGGGWLMEDPGTFNASAYARSFGATAPKRSEGGQLSTFNSQCWEGYPRPPLQTVTVSQGPDSMIVLRFQGVTKPSKGVTTRHRPSHSLRMFTQSSQCSSENCWPAAQCLRLAQKFRQNKL